MTSMSQLKEEEKNFAKFFFLNFKLSAEIVRRFFDRLFPPTNLAQTINNHVPAIINLCNRKRINAVQLDILRSVPGTIWPPNIQALPLGTKPTSSKDFDLTMMICLLRNIGGLSTPSNGWDKLPHPNDTLPGANLATLKWYRNQLAHTTVTVMDNKEFTDKWTLVEKTLTSLNNGQRPYEVTEILNYDFDGEHAKTLANAELMQLKNDYMECEKEKEQIERDFFYYREGNIPKKIAEANEALVETWLNDDDLFYETKGSELVYDKVMDCSCILVTSKSGLGKTATIRHIAIKLQQKGYEIVPIESPRDIIKFNTNTQQVFLIDDVLGKYDLSPTLLEKWERLNEKLITCFETKLGSSKILCTLRLHIVSQERFQNASTILNKEVFNLEHDSNILSKDEKQKILLKHLSRNNLEKKVSANEVEIMCESNYAFPLLCKLVSNDDDRFQKRIAFFKQPLSLLNEELTKMRLENKKLYCILVVCMLFNGSISRSIFDIDSDTYDEKVYRIMHTCGLNRNMSKKELEDSALSAIGSYFSKDSNNIWFIHDALEETIGCHFQTFNPRIMYSECDILFIRDRIRVVSNEHNDGSIDEHIVVIREDDLDKDSLSPLYYRFWTELNNGRFSSVLMSHPFKNRAFVHKFGIIYDRHIHTILFKASSERRQSRNQSVFEQALKILSNEKFQSNKDAISRVIEARDVRSTLIDWIVAFGCYEFFKYGWNKMTTIERKLILGRYGTFLPSYDSFLPLAVLGGSIDIVTKLIRHGADVNCFSEFGETPLCIAVKTDQIDMVDLLLRNEAQVNIKVVYPHIRLKPKNAVISNKKQIITLILENDLNQTKLHEALRKNDLEQLKSNIQAGNIDSKTKSGLTVLHYAILLDDVKAVKVLFRHEFYENDMCSVPTPNVSIVENNGLTAVHLAVINNNVDILYLLLLNKADLNICDNSNRTPLHYTTSESATKLLLAYNTQNLCLETNRIEDQTTEYKKRPIISALKTTFLNITLHTAFRGRFRDFVNLPDKEGNTPLHAVIERRLSKQESSDCINVLLENGANPSLINDMCISALELMDRCGDTEKYVNDSATHRQLIEKTHKKLALSTLILTALTFLFFNYLIINKENQDNFNCGEQDAEPGNIILVQVMKRRSVLLTAILLWTILMLTYNVRYSVFIKRCCFVLAFAGGAIFILLGEFVYIQYVKKFSYVEKIISLVVLCKKYLEMERFITHVTGVQLIHRRRLKITMIILLFFCLCMIMLVSLKFNADEHKYNLSTMRVIYALNITASNCTKFSFANILCTSSAYNITYKNGVDFLVRCRTDPNIIRYNGTLTVESEFANWSEIAIITLLWSNVICTYCFVHCFSIVGKRKLIRDITLKKLPFFNGMAVCFFAHLFLYINIHIIIIMFVTKM